MLRKVEELRPGDKINDMMVVTIHWNEQVITDRIKCRHAGVRIVLAHQYEYELSHRLDENKQIIYDGEVQVKEMTFDFGEMVPVDE